MHYGHTKRWALETGFTAEDAEVIARADINVDRIHKGSELRNWGWHFMMAGAGIRARFLLRASIREDDLVKLGHALHCAQDSIAHGVFGHLVHWDGIDIWERRTPKTRRRLEERSKKMLLRYRLTNR